MQNHEIDTWDYQWTLKIAEKGGFCINPSKNLVSNIGFEGTHYSGATEDLRLNAETYEIEKIIHPVQVEINETAVELIYKDVFYIDKFRDILQYIKRRPLFLFRKDFWMTFG